MTVKNLILLLESLGFYLQPLFIQNVTHF